MSVAPRRRAGPARAVRDAVVVVALAGTLMARAAPAEPASFEIRVARLNTQLACWTVAPGDEIRIAYIHSVTRTPVEERYRVDGMSLRQSEIRFVEHGPGLPTEADSGPGASWVQHDGRFVVQLARTFETITARVDPDQSPRLAVAGESVDLAQWGRASIEFRVRSGACTEASATNRRGA